MGKKDQEKKEAKKLFLEGVIQKEIAARLRVQPKTVSGWVKKGNWKILRDTRINSVESQLEQTRELISLLTDERIKTQTTLTQLREKVKEYEGKEDELSEKLVSDLKTKIANLLKESKGISDDISKHNKVLENLDKTNKISFSAYLYVMDKIFKALRQQNEKLYLMTLDFQDNHLNDVTQNYS